LRPHAIRSEVSYDESEMLSVSNKPLGRNLDGQKRKLKVTKWLGTVPVIAACSACGREFKVPLAALNRVAEAQQSLQLQFAGHSCEAGD